MEVISVAPTDFCTIATTKKTPAISMATRPGEEMNFFIPLFCALTSQPPSLARLERYLLQPVVGAN